MRINHSYRCLSTSDHIAKRNETQIGRSMVAVFTDGQQGAKADTMLTIALNKSTKATPGPMNRTHVKSTHANCSAHKTEN